MDFVFRRLPNERLGIILVSALIVHTAWHWTGDRGSDLLQYRPLAPLLDALPQGLPPWILVVAAAAVPTGQWLRRRRPRSDGKPADGRQPPQPNGASS